MCGIAGQISPQGLPQREPGFYDHILSDLSLIHISEPTRH